jgi:hypothetical protein
MDELYAQRWLVQDILAFRATGVAVALLQYLDLKDEPPAAPSAPSLAGEAGPPSAPRALS